MPQVLRPGGHLHIGRGHTAGTGIVRIGIGDMGQDSIPASTGTDGATMTPGTGVHSGGTTLGTGEDRDTAGVMTRGIMARDSDLITITATDGAVQTGTISTGEIEAQPTDTAGRTVWV